VSGLVPPANDQRASIATRERASVATRERAVIATRERASIATRERASVATRERASVATRERDVDDIASPGSVLDQVACRTLFRPTVDDVSTREFDFTAEIDKCACLNLDHKPLCVGILAQVSGVTFSPEQAVQSVAANGFRIPVGSFCEPRFGPLETVVRG